MRGMKSITRKPFSILAGLAALLVILLPLRQIINGNAYYQPLNNIDGTTLIMIGILLLRGISAGWRDTDLQAVSIAMIGALSFVFTFEAIYKWSFYLLPWKIPPAELRELVIQLGISATVLAGFAFGRLRWNRFSLIAAAIFAAGWIFWLLIGYPQIFSDRTMFPAVLNITLSHDWIYALNRFEKIVLFLVFFSFYPLRKRSDS
jgi:hypothetical protein